MKYGFLLSLLISLSCCNYLRAQNDDPLSFVELDSLILIRDCETAAKLSPLIPKDSSWIGKNDLVRLKVSVLNIRQNLCDGDLPKAISFAKKAREIAKNLNREDIIPAILTRLGFLYQSSGQLDSSTFFFEEGTEMGIKEQDSTSLGACLMGMGINLQQKGEIDAAITVYFKALKIAELINNKSLIIPVKLNINTIYYDHQPENLKISDFHEMLRLSREISDKESEMSILEWLGYLKIDHQEFDSAIYFFNEGLKLTSDNHLNQEILFRQGFTYLYDQKGEHGKAIKNNDQIINLALNSGFEGYLPALYKNNVSNYLKLKDYKNAIVEANKAIEAGEKYGQVELYYTVYEMLAKAHVALKDFENAYQSQRTFAGLSQSILDERKSNQINKLQIEYETEQKESKIRSLSQETQIQDLKLKQQRYGLIGLAGILVVLIAGTVLLIYQRRLREKQKLTNVELEETKKRLLLEKQYRDAELKALRAQMNPHFVFNALNSIQEYIITNEKKLAGKYLAKFASLMRTYLNHSQVKEITIEEELNALNLYLDLEKLRFEDTLEYHLSVDNDVDKGITIPSFLAQPFVENAIKHGLFHKQTDRQLWISFSISADNQLVYSIRDNGIGRAKSEAINNARTGHQSFATKASESRLDLLNQERDMPIQIETIDLQDENGLACGTSVTLRIPLSQA